ncbi:hypothetical protein IQ216_11805, partial [Cyanobium sp. LEGE 06143]|nr:hypothetical protein [Cyanobium sp. LEGE 06143]
MKRPLSAFGLLLAPVMALPAAPSLAAFSSAAEVQDSSELLARKGGG